MPDGESLSRRRETTARTDALNVYVYVVSMPDGAEPSPRPHLQPMGKHPSTCWSAYGLHGQTHGPNGCDGCPTAPSYLTVVLGPAQAYALSFRACLYASPWVRSIEPLAS